MPRFSPIVFCLLLALLTLPCLADTPKQAYQSYLEALEKATTFEDMAPYLSKEKNQELASVPKEQQKAVLGMVKAMRPVSFKFLNVKVHGSSATLKLSGRSRNPLNGKVEPSKGTVSMVLQDGKWRLDKETWSSTE